MVKFLLDSGVNIQERCCGNFMCPEDRKSSRSDSRDHQWANVCAETNYDGFLLALVFENIAVRFTF